MVEGVCSSLLPDPQKAQQWFYMIKKDKPRYIRDQLQIIRATIAKTELDRLAKVVDYCLADSITRATDFQGYSFPGRETEIRKQGSLPQSLKWKTHSGSCSFGAREKLLAVVVFPSSF
ncbi:hypothetical protein [Cesiribacter sp. SM1]|uniref:hypothetical protein n=1 Tax=Cesiribacter sp. SM1 TaxID=2861196 RepID=UPI001CD6AF06|nr:hypothetical protein [Cesiribacter sp. SM1]